MCKDTADRPGLSTRKTLPGNQFQKLYFQGGGFEATNVKDVKVFHKIALEAAKYDKSKTVQVSLPRDAKGGYDYQTIIKNVCRWVEDALEKDSGSAKRKTNSAVAEWWVEQKKQNQFGIGAGVDRTKINDWVCIEHARLAGMICRCLGFGVRDVNIGAIKIIKTKVVSGEKQPVWGEVLQTAALDVWDGKKWVYIDPYVNRHSVEATLIALNYGTLTFWTVWTSTETPPSYLVSFKPAFDRTKPFESAYREMIVPVPSMKYLIHISTWVKDPVRSRPVPPLKQFKAMLDK